MQQRCPFATSVAREHRLKKQLEIPFSAFEPLLDDRQRGWCIPNQQERATLQLLFS
jgi:hypothetical protein